MDLYINTNKVVNNSNIAFYPFLSVIDQLLLKDKSMENHKVKSHCPIKIILDVSYLCNTVVSQFKYSKVLSEISSQ